MAEPLTMEEEADARRNSPVNFSVSENANLRRIWATLDAERSAHQRTREELEGRISRALHVLTTGKNFKHSRAIAILQGKPTGKDASPLPELERLRAELAKVREERDALDGRRATLLEESLRGWALAEETRKKAEALAKAAERLDRALAGDDAERPLMTSEGLPIQGSAWAELQTALRDWRGGGA